MNGSTSRRFTGFFVPTNKTKGQLGQDFPLPCFQRLPDLGLPRFPSGNVGILEMPGAALEYRRRKMSPAFDEPHQNVRTAQKAPYVGDMKFKRSDAALAASLQSLSGCAHGCRNEYNDQSFHWLH